jgi:hypothetical protein
MTIGKRVIFATSAALVTVVLLLSVFAYQLVKRELLSRVDVTLRTRATELTPSAAAGTQEFRSVIAAPGELVQLLSANGKAIRPPYQVTVLPTGERERAIAADSGSATETIDVAGRRMRLVTSHIAADEALQIGAFVQHALEFFEIGFDLVDHFLVAGQFKQGRCITARHTGNGRIFCSHRRALFAVKLAREKPSPQSGA